MSDPIRLRDDRATPAKVRAVLAHARRTPAMSASAVARTRPNVRGRHSLFPAAAAGVGALFGWKSLVLAAALAAAGVAWVALHGRVPVVAPPPPPATASVPVPPGVVKPAKTTVTSPPPSTQPSATAVLGPIATPPRTSRIIARAPSPAASPSASVAQPPSFARAKLEEEVRLLGEGRSMLDVDPAKALVAAETHAERHATGQLRLERELLAVDALDRLGRRDAARARARAALLSAKGSLYETRFRARAEIDP